MSSVSEAIKYPKIARVKLAPFRPDLRPLTGFRLRCPIKSFNSVPQDMRQYLKGTHHISLKQVPSALTLRHAGSPSVRKGADYLLDAGFRIEEYSQGESKTLYRCEDGETWETPTSYRTIGDLLDVDTSIATSTELSAQEEAANVGFTKVEPSFKKKTEGKSLRILYEDFFRIMSGRFLADSLDLDTKPNVLIWSGDVKRLQDPISPNLFRWEKFGKTLPRNRIRFQDVASPEVQMDFLLRHTHWGNKLQQLCREESMMKSGNLPLDDFMSNAPTTATTLRKVINHLLEGKPDPRWTNEFRASVYADQKVRDRHSRSSNFLEMLKTVDGIAVQRMCCYPHEEWTYEKYDIFVLNLIWELSSDMFIDGQLQRSAFEVSSRFSELKRARKAIKHQTLTEWGDLSATDLFNKKARWLRFFLPLYEEMKNEGNSVRKKYLAGTLSQTRGAGKPPSIVNLQSKIKFLLTVQIPEEITPTAQLLIRAAMTEILREIPDHAFTGLRTKASLSVNSNASFEKTKKEHGTIAAVQEFCAGRDNGDKAMKYDLETGHPEAVLEEDATPGEYIFWRALEELLWLTPQQRKQAFLAVVNEPGKSRSITKTRACVKIVLDVVNKLCAVPLAKGIQSSSSGMEASNHAWNLFKAFESKDFEELLFEKLSIDQKGYTDYTLIRAIYARIFVVSTDYETATDFLSHTVAKEIGLAWMYKCGIPKLLRDLVCEVAYGPRTIQFYGNVGIGQLVNEEKQVYSITTSRGVLMGDPLTKIVLHLVNVVTRLLAKRVGEADFLSSAFGPIESIETLAVVRRATDLA